jgi:hypothetical protein
MARRTKERNVTRKLIRRMADSLCNNAPRMGILIATLKPRLLKGQHRNLVAANAADTSRLAQQMGAHRRIARPKEISTLRQKPPERYADPIRNGPFRMYIFNAGQPSKLVSG